jgi:dienelactone hydrolase
MVERDIEAPPFLLRSYARIDRPESGTARVYIEGDGLAWLSRSRPSPDPTPINPVALSLANADNAANVVYLARPCQYNRTSTGRSCADRYWRSSRFAPEVIASFSKALDHIKAEHKLGAFELVGFSGGGAVALLVASERRDIRGIITVAGTLDTDAFTLHHGVSPLRGSLNPARIARRVNQLPQLHVIGGSDRIVPRQIYESYRMAAGASDAISVLIVPEVDHETGWFELWPSILAQWNSLLPKTDTVNLTKQSRL